MHVAQQYAGAGHGIPGVDFETREFLQRKHPAAERHAATRHAGARARHRDPIPRRRGLAQSGSHGRIIRRHNHPVGMPALQSGGVLQVDGWDFLRLDRRPRGYHGLSY